MNTPFVWDPNTDPEYQIGLKNAEQEVVDMMVGRGMLFSSVTASAFQQRTQSLQISYRNAAYEKYVDNRNFQLQLAQIQYGREDEQWNRQMELAKFQADREDAQFQKDMAQAELALSREKFTFDKNMAQEQQKVQNNVALIAVNRAKRDAISSSYATYDAEWKASGTASSEVAAFFNVKVGSKYSANYNSMKARADKLALISTMDAQIEADSLAWQDYEGLLGDIQGYVEQDSGSTADPYGKDTMALGTVSQNQRYDTAYQAMRSITDINKLYEYRAKLTTNAADMSKVMGIDLLNRLRYEATKRIEEMTSASKMDNGYPGQGT